MIHKSSVFVLILLAAGLGACRDESLNPYVEPQPGVHGFAATTDAKSDAGAGTANVVSLGYNTWATSGSPFVFRWFSFDKKLTVSKVEFYAYFSIPYVDKEGNPAVAALGGAAPAGGKLIPSATLENLPNGEKKKVTITVDQVYQLYKDATFDFNGDGTKENVFTDDARPATSRFLTDDNILIRWKLYASDGAVYRSWSPSIESGEPKFSNASFDWTVE